MRIGLISDTHFQNWQTFGQCHEKKISKRLLQQKDNFIQAASFFKKERVDLIVHGGDWVHQVGGVSNEVLNISNDLLDDLTIPILFVCGNHDTPVRISPKKHHLLTNILNKLRSKAPKEEWVNGKVCLLNFHDDIDYDKIKGYDLAVIHKTPVGSNLGTYTFRDGVNWRKLSAQNKFVAFAHIHQMQKLSENCFVIGSPMHLGFGDEGRRGVWIIDTDTGKCNFHKLDYPEFITVDSQDKIKDDGNYYTLLGARSKLENDNVISVVVPQVFDERIKAQDFNGIIREWLAINNKDDTYLELVKDILDEKLSLVKDIYKGRLTDVKIKDFLSVGDVEYKIPDKGFTLVSGDSDSFSSNGSGKSTIIGESICWGLTGETTKGLTGGDVVRRGQNDCSVELTICLDNDSYVIRRTVLDGLSITPYKHGCSVGNITSGMRKPDRQDYLENSILGFGKKLLLASVYFSQENVLMLTKMTDTETTNMVTDLLGFEQYDDLQSMVDKKIKKFDEDILVRDRDKVNFDRDLAVKRSELAYLDKGIEDKKRQIHDFGQSVQSYQEVVTGLTAKLHEEEIIDKVDYSSQIKELNEKQDLLANKIDAIRESREEAQEEYNRLYAKVTTLRIDADTISRERQKVEKEIDDLKSVKIDVRCDKCGAVITGENIDSFIEEKNYRILGIDAEWVVSDAKLKSQELILENAKDQLTKLNSKEKSFILEQSNIKPQLLSLNSLNNAQKEKEQDLLFKEERIRGEINKYTSSIKDYSDRIVLFEEELIKLKNDRVAKSIEIKIVESYISDIDHVVDEYKVSIDKLGFWKTAFSPKGIRSVLLDRFCNDANSKLNEYLSTISGGTMSIMITPTKTIKSGEERNKIGMSIQLNGNEVKYDALSGGEKRRVDVSVCFGLNKFVSEKYGVVNGVLGLVILDEVFSFLDKAGEESVAELLWNEGKNKSVFVIDHALNLSSYANSIWVVHKDKDISTLEILKQ